MSNFADRASVWLATGAGVGLVSPAPGTIGGLWGLPLAWIIGQSGPLSVQYAAVALIGLVSVAICSRAARVLGGSKDPQAIVLDEIGALPIVYLGFAEKSVAVWLVGWALFRLFDITKPSPAREMEKLPRGWGIMADDWVAAGYAWLVLNLLARFGWIGL